MSKKAVKTVQAEENTTQDNLPLFYKKPMCIDIKRHKNSGMEPIKNCKFAAKTNSIPLNVNEFVEAAKYYPIVFTADETPIPVVITGLESDNYFVDSEYQWKADCYVPEYVRKYPFVLLHVVENNQFVLCVDEAAEQFKSDKTAATVPFYSVDDKPSELSISAFNASMNYHRNNLISGEFTKFLKEEGLLQANTSTATLASGRIVTLNGFNMIDQEKFSLLPDSKILELHKRGWLALIHFALMSTSNWKRIADMASELEPAAKGK